MGTPKANPFTPNMGLAPPLRTGHEQAALTLGDMLTRICGGKAGGGVVLCGPRGNGKTALLGELCRKARDAGVLACTLIPASMRGDSRTVTGQPRDERKPGPGTDSRDGNGVFDFCREAGLVDDGQVDLRSALRSLSTRSPVVLVVDGAHEMPAAPGKVLLQAVQALMMPDFPLLLALAGTPGIKANLRGMRAGFEWWEQLRIGRLESDEAVRDALAIPARIAGLPIDGDALDLLAAESERYPFLVQLLGDRSWDAATSRGARTVTLADAREGVAAARSRMRDLHGGRRQEAIDLGILAEAEAVSRAVVDRKPTGEISHEDLMGVLREAETAGGRDPKEALEMLANLGLVWENPGQGWEPAIPSLCGFLAGQAEGDPRDTG